MLLSELQKPYLGLINFDHVTSINISLNPSVSPLVEVEVKFFLSEREISLLTEQLKKYTLTEV